MSEIMLMVGPSGSGKTSAAMDYLTKGYVKVSRDDIRMSLFGYTPEDIGAYYTRKGLGFRENLVTSVQDAIIKRCLDQEIKVVVDNTHLRPKYILAYKKYKVPIKLHIMDVPLERCIEQDKMRLDQVGEEIIRRQYSEYEKIKEWISEQGLS